MESTELNKRPEPVSFLEALIYWLKLGFISFGQVIYLTNLGRVLKNIDLKIWINQT